MAKAMRVPMTCNRTEARVFWMVKRDRGFWSFVDHEGYERIGGTTWRELVDRFTGSAENYNLRHRLS